VARTLMDRAALIVMLPSSRPGTLEEIDTILSNPALIEKTVFLDPPNLAGSRTYNQAREWAPLQAAFARRGFTLPADDRRGALLHFGDAKTPILQDRLDIDADDRIGEFFARVRKRLAEGRRATA